MTDLDVLAAQAADGDAFAELAILVWPTREQFDQLLGLAGRNNAPALLFDAWHTEGSDRDMLAEFVGPVWSGAEYPDQNLPRESWREMFTAAGFRIDGQPADRPKKSLTLYRGSVPERRTDWSWSTDRKVAEGYANGTSARRPQGRLYRVVAPPAALLCANNERQEAEYVIDTHGLHIEEQRP